MVNQTHSNNKYKYMLAQICDKETFTRGYTELKTALRIWLKDISLLKKLKLTHQILIWTYWKQNLHIEILNKTVSPLWAILACTIDTIVNSTFYIFTSIFPKSQHILQKYNIHI